MVSDIFKSLRSGVNERLSNPLLSAFLISWLIWNYEFILVIFSSRDVMDKLRIIETVLYPCSRIGFHYLLLFPIGSALIYLLVFPYPAKWMFKYVSKRNNELRQVKVSIDDESPLSRQEALQLKRSFRAELQLQFSNIQDLEDEVDLLKAENAELISRINPSDGAPHKDMPKGDALSKRATDSSRPSTKQGNRAGTSHLKSQKQAGSKEQIPATVTITKLIIGSESFQLGAHFENSAPGSVNVLGKALKMRIGEKVEVVVEIDGSLSEDMKLKIFDGNSSTITDKLGFTLHKTDFEQKNCLVQFVTNNNPLRPGKELVVSNKIQFRF